MSERAMRFGMATCVGVSGQIAGVTRLRRRIPSFALLHGAPNRDAVLDAGIYG